MNKFGAIMSILAISLASCTNQNKTQKDTLQDSIKADNMKIDSHNSQNSLDWIGIYEGTLPCDDCEGIKTVIELKEDNTYNALYTYLGKSENENEFNEIGTLTWNTTGSNITLKSESDTTQYKVGENKLILLNAEGRVNKSDMADRYILKKKV